MTDLELLRRHGDTLTAKEHEAFELCARGMSERAAADALDLSRSGLRARLESARRKLHAALRQSSEAA